LFEKKTAKRGKTLVRPESPRRSEIIRERMTGFILSLKISNFRIKPFYTKRELLDNCDKQAKLRVVGYLLSDP